MLELSGITHRFGDRPALDGVSFAVPPGQVFGFLGPNGSGKTTLMRIIFGVIEPDGGEVRFDGRAATADQRRTWGYMPQARGLYPDMRTLDQLTYFGRLHGMGRAAAQRAATELLEQLALADRADDKVSDLSGGMQQRVQLAAALVHDPPVVVLDEPFAGLDPVAVDHLAQVVTERAEAGRTVLFSSHQLDLVEDLCEELVMVDRGRVVLEGRVRELRAGSGGRELRLDLDLPDHSWATALPGVEVVDADATGVRLRLDTDVDALDVLDRARALGPVTDFGLDLPSLTRLFLDAVGRDRFEQPEAGGPSDEAAGRAA